MAIFTAGIYCPSPISLGRMAKATHVLFGFFFWIFRRRDETASGARLRSPFWPMQQLIKAVTLQFRRRPLRKERHAQHQEPLPSSIVYTIRECSINLIKFIARRQNDNTCRITRLAQGWSAIAREQPECHLISPLPGGLPIVLDNVM